MAFQDKEEDHHMLSDLINYNGVFETAPGYAGSANRYALSMNKIPHTASSSRCRQKDRVVQFQDITYASIVRV